MDLTDLDALIDDIVAVQHWALDHLDLLAQGAPPVASALRHLGEQAARGDFPDLLILRKTCGWVLITTYWRDRLHTLSPADSDVRLAAERLWAAMDAANQ